LLAISEALRAADETGFAVIAMPWLNVVDPGWIADVSARYPMIVTIDNHYRAGGQGQYLLAALAEHAATKARCLSLGLDDVPPCGRNDEVLAALALDGESIARRIRAFVSA
jgi:transketolase